MKKLVMLSIVVLGLVFESKAQKPSANKKKVMQKTATKKAKAASSSSTTVVLMNNGSNQAKQSSAQSFRISDPTVVELNQRAAGAQPKTSPVIGMPKSTYGIANGKILLRNTTATTPGTAYGSGAVGTGTSIIGAGTSEATLGVNGKSPYAGPWLWGDRRVLYSVADSTRRQ